MFRNRQRWVVAWVFVLAVLAGCERSAAPVEQVKQSPAGVADDGPKIAGGAAPTKRDVFAAVPPVTESDNGRYIVHFKEPTLASHVGALAKKRGLPAARASVRRSLLKDPLIVTQRAELERVQKQRHAQIAALLGRDAVVRSFHAAVNASVMKLDVTEAQRIAKLPTVKFVEPDRIQPLATDRGPSWIGAQGIWDGSTSGVASQGEHMVVGIVDTGIAFDVEVDGKVGPHPSFASVAGDGYVHENPLGEGVYLGACKQHPEWCTSKLIGIYSFLEGSNGPGKAPDDAEIWSYKDIGGHGSHVASTAAGNVLFNVPLLDADGQPTSVKFPRISGVAPRANIIAYKVCATTGCAASDIVAAIDQAIEDGIVDAINHSISSGGASPWYSGQALAFLSAREAGIFVASAAGNSGPAPGTATESGNAPWNAAVAATTHDRYFPSKQLKDMSGGDTPAPAAITGFGATGGFTGHIVYAKNFKVGSAGEDNFDHPELCLQAFPAGTFEPDMIVLCDRGVNARTDKGKNVHAGGAGGMILGNVAGGAASTDPDAHVLPAIHIDATSATALKTWLASGTGHMGTIEAAPPPSGDPSMADSMADFSSRGPFIGFDFFGPNVAAPGSNILAAGSGYADAEDVPGLFGIISGTSMATPHITGSAALLKAVRPSWTDAEVLSAMMTTGVTTLKKERGAPADAYDIGGGRIDLGAAARAGLLLDETIAGFDAADPELGGDPAELNIAQLVRSQCVVECGWHRTLEATTAGSWTVHAPSYVRVTPSEFALDAGATQAISIVVDARSLPVGESSFGSIELQPADAAVPTQHLSFVVVSTASDLPAEASIVATRSQGSTTLSSVRSVAVDELSFHIEGLAAAEKSEHEVGQDSDPSSAYDDVSDGVSTTLVPFPDGADLFVVEISESDGVDLDLRVGLDLDGNGAPSEDEEICIAATSALLERCIPDLTDAPDSHPQVWVSVQNYQASAKDTVDTYTLAVTKVGKEAVGNLAITAPKGPIDALAPWDLRFDWTAPSTVGDLAYGRVAVYRSSEQSDANLLGTVTPRLVRELDDVAISAPAGVLKVGQTLPVKLTVRPTRTDVARTYDIDVKLPDGLSYVAGSGGELRGGKVSFAVTRDATEADDLLLTFDARVKKGAGGKSLSIVATHTVDEPHTVPETASADVRVSRYALSFLAPTTPNSTAYIGLPVLLRFGVRDAESGKSIQDAKVRLTVTDPTGKVVATVDPASSLFGSYFYMLSTLGLSPGAYTVTATLDDGTQYDMTLTLKSFGGLFGRS